ncbi:MAG TPA: DUF2924 domain-containing protein, partial [Xanthobacteraceae bacterium]|nr:DUF2924 domain-containing protein [Xanthobacteraceae bacterium]
MKPSIDLASARQNADEPSLGRDRSGSLTGRARGPGPTTVNAEIAELVDRSTQELRLAWRQLHRTGPPQGLSRDLLIRALATQLQEQTHGGASRVLRRRLQTLAGEFEKGSVSFDPGVVPKIGTTLAREWRGRTHLVLVREDGFEYEGKRYRSLTVIAEQITGAHWSGPRFFGLTKGAG